MPKHAAASVAMRAKRWRLARAPAVQWVDAFMVMPGKKRADEKPVPPSGEKSGRRDRSKVPAVRGSVNQKLSITPLRAGALDGVAVLARARVAASIKSMS